MNTPMGTLQSCSLIFTMVPGDIWKNVHALISERKMSQLWGRGLSEGRSHNIHGSKQTLQQQFKDLKLEDPAGSHGSFCDCDAVRFSEACYLIQPCTLVFVTGDLRVLLTFFCSVNVKRTAITWSLELSLRQQMTLCWHHVFNAPSYKCQMRPDVAKQYTPVKTCIKKTKTKPRKHFLIYYYFIHQSPTN